MVLAKDLTHSPVNGMCNNGTPFHSIDYSMMVGLITFLGMMICLGLVDPGDIQQATFRRIVPDVFQDPFKGVAKWRKRRFPYVFILLYGSLSAIWYYIMDRGAGLYWYHHLAEQLILVLFALTPTNWILRKRHPFRHKK